MGRGWRDAAHQLGRGGLISIGAVGGSRSASASLGQTGRRRPSSARIIMRAAICAPFYDAVRVCVCLLVSVATPVPTPPPPPPPPPPRRLTMRRPRKKEKCAPPSASNRFLFAKPFVIDGDAGRRCQRHTPFECPLCRRRLHFVFMYTTPTSETQLNSVKPRKN